MTDLDISPMLLEIRTVRTACAHTKPCGDAFGVPVLAARSGNSKHGPGGSLLSGAHLEFPSFLFVQFLSICESRNHFNARLKCTSRGRTRTMKPRILGVRSFHLRQGHTRHFHHSLSSLGAVLVFPWLTQKHIQVGPGVLSHSCVICRHSPLADGQ